MRANEFRWTVVYRDAQGRTVHELYRTKHAALREAKRLAGRVYPYGKEPVS
jgi:hypothetical protein